MDFTTLNKVGKGEDFLPTKKMSDLEVGQEYQITDVRTAKTKFGQRVIAELNGEFSVFLPARVAKAFLKDEQSLEKMIELSGAEKLFMTYLGGPYNAVTFKEEP